MLDPFIIAEIIRREREEREKGQQRELPLQMPLPCYQDSEEGLPPEEKRGVIEIDL